MSDSGSIERIIEKELKFGSGLYSLKPVNFVKGAGAYLFTDKNEKYLDFMSGHGVACLGHGHPALVSAIQEQSANLITLHSSYPHELRAQLFELLAQITPKNITKGFLVNSGTEAVEGALKLAIAAKRDITNPNIIAFKRSFHGRTLGALSLTFNPSYKRAFKPFLLKNVRFASYNNIDSVKEMMDENTIAVVIEPVQGEGGVHPADGDFFHELREICSAKDILLIADEVQTGFGRCGKMFACQHYGIEPDIMACAKGIAGGFPMGAVLSTGDIFSRIKKGEHATTFGGNILATAASVATINTLLSENIPQNAAKMGKLIMDKLQKFPMDKIRDIRGLGLLIGVQVKTKAGPYISQCFKNNVIFLPAGLNVVRMLPPLIITENEVNIAMKALEDALTG